MRPIREQAGKGRKSAWDLAPDRVGNRKVPKVEGHHLILGQLTDFLTGRVLDDTHDERYRQKLARLLVEQKGYAKADVLPRRELRVSAGNNCALIWI